MRLIELLFFSPAIFFVFQSAMAQPADHHDGRLFFLVVRLATRHCLVLLRRQRLDLQPRGPPSRVSLLVDGVHVAAGKETS